MIPVMSTDDPGFRLPKPVAGDLRIHKLYAGPDRWLEIARRAKAAGMSASAYLNELVDRDKVDDSGRPVWRRIRTRPNSRCPDSPLPPTRRTPRKPGKEQHSTKV